MLNGWYDWQYMDNYIDRTFLTQNKNYPNYYSWCTSRFRLYYEFIKINQILKHSLKILIK